eukprot:1843207-Amphidinium_carterae.1
MKFTIRHHHDTNMLRAKSLLYAMVTCATGVERQFLIPTWGRVRFLPMGLYLCLCLRVAMPRHSAAAWPVHSGWREANP